MPCRGGRLQSLVKLRAVTISLQSWTQPAQFVYDDPPASGRRVLFSNLAIKVREIHKQKESASFRCIKVPTAGD
jgi:hypothetical protein